MEWIDNSDIKLILICLYEYLKWVEEGKTNWEPIFAEQYLKPLIDRLEQRKLIPLEESE